jgi:hypothetical protein
MAAKYINTMLMLSLAVCIIAALLKLMHIQGSNLLLLASLPAVAICAFAKNAIGGTLKGVLTGTAIAWACVAVLFKLMKWPNGDVIFKSAFVIGAMCMVYNYFIARQPGDEE